MANKAIERKINTINKFFNINNAEELNKFRNSTDVICASNVICHIPDLNDLILSVGKKALYF